MAPAADASRLPELRRHPGGGPELPSWYPAWAHDLAELYFSGTTCLFVLHGNVHDLIRCVGGDGDTYCGLPEFLATQLFGSWDVVLHYDLAAACAAGRREPKRLQGMVQYLAGAMGDPAPGRATPTTCCWRWTG